MKRPALNFFRATRQVGLSIVEFMVAILISGIVLAGVLQVVITSKSTFLGQEEMSFIQENARFALDIIGRDVQSAGYLGCAGASADVALVAKFDDPADGVLVGMEPVLGYEGEGASVFPALFSDRVRPILEAGSSTVQDRPDSLIVRRADGTPFPLQDHTDTTITLTDASDFEANDLVTLVAEDCRRVGVIRLASANATQLGYTAGATVCGASIKPNWLNSVVCDGACNCQGNIASINNYQPGSTAQRFSASAYFIGTSTAVDGQPALKRMVMIDGEAEEEELALGVEDMEIVYGIDTDNDAFVDSYVNADNIAANNWGQVYAVQVSLLFRSQAPSLPEAQNRSELGNDYNDRYMRQVVTATYRLRNRI